jgi:hypothetical protein
VWAHQENLDLETSDADFKKDHDDRLLVGLRKLPDPLSLKIGCLTCNNVP